MQVDAERQSNLAISSCRSARADKTSICLADAKIVPKRRVRRPEHSISPVSYCQCRGLTSTNGRVCVPERSIKDAIKMGVVLEDSSIIIIRLRQARPASVIALSWVMV